MVKKKKKYIKMVMSAFKLKTTKVDTVTLGPNMYLDT